MVAYSENKEYCEGEQVYVLTPLGDTNQKKLILGRVVEIDDAVAEARPFESYAPITQNFNDVYNTSLDEYTFVVNRDYSKLLLDKKFVAPMTYAGYDRMGLKISLYANLKTLTQTVVSGRYRIKVGLDVIEQKKALTIDPKSQVVSKTFFFDMEDMVFINPYDTFGYCNQEKVFDISDCLITRIRVYIVQNKEEEPFLDEYGEKVSSDSFYIKIKNIVCDFGYECHRPDIGTKKLYAFSLSGDSYNFTNYVKDVGARMVSFYLENNLPRGKIVEDYTDSNFSNRAIWGLYDTDSSTIDANFKDYPGYVSIGTRPDNTLSLNNNKGIQNHRYRLSCSDVVSNEILFTNLDFMKNAELLDNIMGFTGRISDNRDNFNIYGLDNKLINDFNENQVYNLIVSYNSVNGRTIKIGDKITWTFPSSNTMIIPVENDKFLKEGMTYTRVVSNDDIGNLYRDENFWIPFKIKGMYNQNFIDNTIKCTLSFEDENGYDQVLEFSKALSFGFSGSEGPEYIFNIELKKNNKKIQSIRDSEYILNKDLYTLDVKVYDYNMNEIEKANVIVNWITGAQFGDALPQPQDRIIVASYGGAKSYLPIGTLLTDIDYFLEGCKTITYDGSGRRPYFYKEKYNLKQGQTTYGADYTITPKGFGYPEIADGKIIPSEVYVEGLNRCFITATVGTEAVINFPIVIIQNPYSSLLEYENTMDIKDDTIIKTLLGYLSNTQSGLILGKKGYTNKETSKSTIGLYGYKTGIPFFTLDDENGLVIDGGADSLLGTLSNCNLINCSISGSVSGTSDSAKRLVNNSGGNLNVGDSTTPVYFSAGVPKACTLPSYALSSTVSALQQQVQQLSQKIDELQRQIDALPK